MRAGRMAHVRNEGKSVEEIAGMFGVSVRTVQRALKWWGE
jgi:transposase